MKAVNFKKEINSTVDEAISRVTEVLKAKGFGILTRIDFHTKMKEKLGKDMPETVILGACNPAMAYEAFQKNPDVTSLLPCNVVVRKLSQGRVSIEVAKPTLMMEMLGEKELIELAKGADEQLASALASL